MFWNKKKERTIIGCYKCKHMFLASEGKTVMEDSIFLDMKKRNYCPEHAPAYDLVRYREQIDDKLQLVHDRNGSPVIGATYYLKTDYVECDEKGKIIIPKK